MNINEKLLESIFNEDLEQVKECLAQGANVNGVIVLDTTNKNKDKQIMDFLIEKGAKRGTTTITEKLKYDKALECEDYLDKLETQNKPKIKEKSKSKTKSKSNDFGIGM